MASSGASADRPLGIAGERAARLLRVLVHLQRHLDEAPRLAELAAIAGYSPFHFHRLFRGMVGESLAQHVQRLRLERAAVQLRTGRQPIVRVALRAGYESHEAFTRAFGRAFGCSPREYRAAKAAPGAPESPSAVHLAPDGGEPAFRPLTLAAYPFDAAIREAPARSIAFVRHTGPYAEVARAWERLTDWAGSAGRIGGDTLFLGACHDDPEVTEPARLRYDACITVEPAFAGEGAIGAATIDEGRFAVTLHEGPYERLGETYAALIGRWLPAHGLEPGDPPCLEHYLNDPESTEPEDLLTEVWVRVRR